MTQKSSPVKRKSQARKSAHATKSVRSDKFEPMRMTIAVSSLAGVSLVLLALMTTL